uniref:Poly [ADP-ribose] polymerase n=1 Tax=Caenorhabditis tropicalis TaxID=1561998 RepID=A0A1I7U1S0_9PELO
MLIEFVKRRFKHGWLQKTRKMKKFGDLRCAFNHSYFERYLDLWYHYECFWRKLACYRIQINLSSIRGVDLIRWEDQLELSQRIRKFKEWLNPVGISDNTRNSTVEDKPSSSGKRRSDEPIEIDNEEEIIENESEFQRKRRLGKSARLAALQEGKMKKQTDELCKNIQFFNSMTPDDRILILEVNGHEVPGNHDYDRDRQIIEKLADYALFGCPIHCVKCFNGIIVYNPSRRIYACSGYNGTLVDTKFSLAEKCHVVKNALNGSVYEAKLSSTDLSMNRNAYCTIQLLKNDESDEYYVFQSWGRVGTKCGGSYFEKFNKEDGIAKFERLFFSNTGNQWKYRKYFRKMPGYSNMIETDNSEIIEIGNQYVVPGSKTSLPQSVKEVVMSIFNIDSMKTALKSFEMDLNKMPLGCLSRNQINQAFDVLNDISDLIVELPIREDKLLDATNKFYNIIPHNFGMKAPELIDSLQKIIVSRKLAFLSSFFCSGKNHMLNALLDIKFAYDQICGSNPTRGIPGVDPVDTNYENLKCIMTPLERDSEDWKLISEYLYNTQGSTHDVKVDLIDILKLDRADESLKFNKKIENRRLLWHGSGKMNFAGILGQGLRIAPPEAPASGYMFGKGIYFADMFSKSFFYCHANENDEAYLLLCDVALGVMTECMKATQLSKYTIPWWSYSVKGIGRECPMKDGDYVHPDGYIIPKGKVHRQLQGTLNQDYFLLYNEYVVYDVDQIQMKYLVRVKMHHARHLM